MAKIEANLKAAKPEDRAQYQDSLDTIFGAIRAAMTEATMETSRVLQVCTGPLSLGLYAVILIEFHCHSQVAARQRDAITSEYSIERTALEDSLALKLQELATLEASEEAQGLGVGPTSPGFGQSGTGTSQPLVADEHEQRTRHHELQRARQLEHELRVLQSYSGGSSVGESVAGWPLEATPQQSVYVSSGQQATSPRIGTRLSPRAASLAESAAVQVRSLPTFRCALAPNRRVVYMLCRDGRHIHSSLLYRPPLARRRSHYWAFLALSL